MDSFDKRIEEYKKELMKYAKKNGTVYSGDTDGFKTAQPIEKQEETKKEKKMYQEQYVSNRPMPSEYLGDDTESEPVNTVPQREGETTSPEKQTYKNYDDFISKNTKSGKLRVQTYASNQVFPIQNARVIVEKSFDDGIHRFIEEYTDIDGVADNIVLPTKSKELSLSPGDAIPYSTYTVRVTHPQFSPVTFHNVPIFEAIESMQPVAMLPVNSPPTFEEVNVDGPDL